MKKIILIPITFFLIFHLILPSHAMSDDYLPHLDKKYGKILLNMRWRYETVNQDGVKNAEAVTIRSRIGYQTPTIAGITGMIEIENTIPFNSGTYRVPGVTSASDSARNRAVIADPRNTEVNRLQLAYTGVKNTTIVFGRQRIRLDNDRFIGNVGWRQNEQTFDAITLKNNLFKGTEIYYGYLNRVNRIFGREAEPYKGIYYWKMNTHIIHLAYFPFSFLKIGGYTYLIRIKTQSARDNSNDTYGVYIKGKYPLINSFKLTYHAEYARQKDNNKNSSGTDFDLDYYHFKSGILYNFYNKSSLNIGVGYEVLEGDGTRGFTTPLATLHAFQGWADKFLTTPANGMEDAYIWTSVNLHRKITLKAVYHKFKEENGGDDYGDEIDCLGVWKIDKHFKLLGKYAHYREDGYGADTDKFIIELNFIY